MEEPVSGPVNLDTEQLVRRAAAGDGSARQQLLVRHRERLRRMVALRLDRRVLARVDPSDVVQEAMADAARKLSDYLRKRPLPFYPWLRQLAWERLVELHRRHVRARKRSVTREQRFAQPWSAAPGDHLPDESAWELAERLCARDTDPGKRVLKEELRARVQAALAGLPPRDREVLILRHLEQLSTKETAAVLGIREGAVKLRQLRALERLRRSLGADSQEAP